MINIRQGVFETNSSSSHSLTLVEDELDNPPFSRYEVRGGILNVELGEFGWEFQRYYRPLNKASYLLTDVLGSLENVRDKSGDMRDEAMTNPRAAAIIRVLEEESGCRVVLTGSGYIDHQSVGNSYQTGETDEEIRKFLFSNSYVTTGNDNSEMPHTISTDYGTVEPSYSSREDMHKGTRY